MTASGVQYEVAKVNDQIKQRGHLVKRNDTQYDLYLEQGDLSMTMLEERVRVHPYITKSSIKANANKLLGTNEGDHESPYNLVFETADNFTVRIGYSKNEKGGPKKAASGAVKTQIGVTTSSSLSS